MVISPSSLAKGSIFAGGPPSTTSYSSVMSPISCSTRSSKVTIPAVPPYSSRTMAIWAFAARIADRARSSFTVSGRLRTGRTMLDSCPPRSPASRSIRSRTWQKPITLSTDPSMTG